MTDYRVYKLRLFEWVGVAGGTGLALFIIGMLFYRLPAAGLLLAAGGVAAPRYYAGLRGEQKRKQLNSQFHQAMLMAAASLSAGKSIENAIQDTLRDCTVLFPDPDTPIVRELRLMANRLRNGVAVETLFDDLAKRSGNAEMAEFAFLLKLCRKQGGNMSEVIRQSAYLLQEKLDMQRDLQIVVARKKWESRFLALSPLGFIGLLAIVAGDYMEPLYSMAIGRVVMTLSLLGVVLCVWWCHRLTDFRV